MAAKRQASSSSEASHSNAAKRRHQFDGASEGISLNQSTDELMGGEVMVGDFDGAAALAAMEGARNHQQNDSMIREQDRFLPIANVSRIMKRVLPESGKVAKEAKECVQECVSEFISFITSEASERCMHEKRKTINGEDILWAMQTLGFDPYVEPLKVYLSKYRLAAKGDKTSSGSGGGGNASGSAEVDTALSRCFPKNVLLVTNQEAGSTRSKDLGADGANEPFILSQDDLILGTSGNQRQVHLATNADGQLTIIEMQTDADGNVVETNDGGATAITLPVLSGSTTGENGTQQYILTTLDQNSVGGAGVQQFTIPAGAQLAFIPTSGTGSSATAQGIPVMFLDSGASSSSAGGSQQQPQYITVNSSGTGGLQIIQIGNTTTGEETGQSGGSRPGTSTVNKEGH